MHLCTCVFSNWACQSQRRNMSSRPCTPAYLLFLSSVAFERPNENTIAVHVYATTLLDSVCVHRTVFTHGFVPPERVLRAATSLEKTAVRFTCQASDVWSYGVTLLHLLHGRYDSTPVNDIENNRDKVRGVLWQPSLPGVLEPWIQTWGCMLASSCSPTAPHQW